MNEMFTKMNLWRDGNGGGGGGQQGQQGQNQGGQQGQQGQNQGGQQQQGNQGQQGQNQGVQAPTYDQWLAKQDEHVRGLIDGNVKGLKSALDDERESRKGFEKTIRDLAKKAEAGSEAQKQLEQLAESVSTANRRTEFYEAAHAAGVTNLKLAFTVATEEGLFDKVGRANFDQLKKDYPELFGTKKAPRGDGGAGNEGQPRGGSMNDFIRKAAGGGRRSD
jgi:hypothetical protein